MAEANGVVSKWGNSQGVRLPKNILEAAEITEGDSVEIVAERNEIRIKKAIKFRTLDELFKDYAGDYQCEEADWGAPVGEEVW